MSANKDKLIKETLKDRTGGRIPQIPPDILKKLEEYFQKFDQQNK